MLALCHDVRVMREDRGFLCLPEIDLGMAFTPGMEALLASKLPQPALHRLAVLGQRWSGPQALAGGVVDGVAAETDVLRIAVERAADLAPKAGLTVTAIRKNFYAATIAALDPSAS
jgi:enoyl-CoA hydratase/carnithine racemase